MFIRKEEFVKDGRGMIRECFGPDESTVTSTIEYTKPVEHAELPEEQVAEASQLDRIEAQTAYISMMLGGGEEDADL